MPDSQEIEDFITATFRSVWALELLHLLQEHRDRTLSHAEMVAGLRASDVVVTQSVETLTAAGVSVVEADGGARYRPVSKNLEALADGAIGLYGKSPGAVRRLIVAAANPGITEFANAFRLRKD